MNRPLDIVLLGLADAINPITIGLVAESLATQRTARTAVVFSTVTLVVNVIATWLLLRGLTAFTSLEDAWWLGTLVAAAGVAVLAQGGHDLRRTHRSLRTADPAQQPIARRWSLSSATDTETAALALVVNMALLPFAAQTAAAMANVSAMHLHTAGEVAWVVGFNVIYTAPLWALILVARTRAGSWRPRSPRLAAYGPPLTVMVLGAAIVAVGLAG